MDPNKQKEIIEKKRAEILAKMAQFQASKSSKPNQLQAQQSSTVGGASSRPAAPPNLSASGTTGSLNMAEIQRKIAEAKARIAANTSATSGASTPASLTNMKPPALPLSGEVDLRAMLDTGLIPRRETVNTKAMQRSKQKGSPATASPLTATTAPSAPTAAPNDKKKAFKLVDTVPPEFTDPTKNPYFDPSMEVKVAPKQRRARQLKFVQPGKYVAIANQERAKAQLEKLKQEITESVKKAGMQAELDVSDKVIKRDPPPAVEWWDAPFLPNKTYDDLPTTTANDGDDNMEVDLDPAQFDTLVTMYVHHPVPIQAPYEVNQTPIVRSLMLTKKELKKMRRQRRAEALKDKRDKIRLGLLEPDAPKVKISNLMRVLGDEAIQDPTKVEAKVRKEMELRQKMHEKANEQRKLTPEEKRTKILNKLKEDQKHINEAAVFKIKYCSHPKLRYKIEINAQQHQLTGMVIVHPKCNLVVVEGGPKAIKAYKKLMLRRIDWNDLPPPKNLAADEGAAMDIDSPNVNMNTNMPGLPEGEENKCFLVWTGPVKTKTFKKFTWRSFESEKMAREELGKWHVENYWDVAVASTDEELAARQPQL